MTSQRLEEGLEAAAHQAAQDMPVNLHLADAGRPLDLANGGDTDEGDVHALCRWFSGHAPETREHTRTGHRWNS